MVENMKIKDFWQFSFVTQICSWSKILHSANTDACIKAPQYSCTFREYSNTAFRTFKKTCVIGPFVKPIIRGISEKQNCIPAIFHGKTNDEIANILAMELNSLLYMFDNFDCK